MPALSRSNVLWITAWFPDHLPVSPQVQTPTRIFRAPWVVPVTSPILQDGAVVVGQESIIAAGPYQDIVKRFPDLPISFCSGVLLPALVNAHIHLDLSVYGTVYPPSQDSSMCDWITSLLKKRQESNYSEEEVRTAAEKVVRDQYDSGVALMLDVSNISLGSFDSSPLEIVSILEMLAPSSAAEQVAITAITSLDPQQAVTGHAPYSTTSGLLRFIKDRSRNTANLFSIHLAENRDEALLLEKGEGCFEGFLKERGAFDGTFPIPGIDSSGVVGYLNELGILDKETICVHCVHLNEQEIKIISDSQAHICLCPASNRFLSVGTVRLQEILDQNILPALGTDSIASNPDLDIWHEMSLLRKEHPAVSPDEILRMATLGGARAMGREREYGSLEEGRSAHFLHVQGEQYEELTSAEQLLDSLTCSGRPAAVKWM